jgi:solute carrier family 25 iron transporter 28/37
MYKSEGIASFYRSFGVNYFMNVPFGSMIIMMNEKLKIIFNVKEGDHHLNYYFCGGLAGAMASIPTTPFDVIKTKLNTQTCLNDKC